MVLSRLIVLLQDHPWRSFGMINLVLVVLEKFVEQDFVCPCGCKFATAFFLFYLMIPLILAIAFGVYLWKSNIWSDSGTPQHQNCSKCGYTCCAKFLTCTVPLVVWLVLFFGDGKYLACVKILCECDSTTTSREKFTIYVSKITALGVIAFILIVAVIDRCCGRCCARCWVGSCCGCCDEFFEECIASRTETSSVYRVRCAVKRTVQRASTYHFSGNSVRVTEREDVALCSVSDGTTVYRITLKGDQISKLQEGKTYIIENATVKEDHPVSEMILGNETEVLRMDPLQLDEKLICKVKESISPSSERAALNDPGLYLKKGYITLTGKVVSPSAPRLIQGIPVRDIVIEEAGVRVTVLLQKEAATEPLMAGQEIKITHVKVGNTQEKKLNSSDYTVISRSAQTPAEPNPNPAPNPDAQDDEHAV
ncbi:uncharacterized protein LOC108417063 isoform X1 [Pygocentrus nattereri]|uniref:uncharacterized protein LOC108417063 isoform X1 n=1 Tax=Pygocentrus nattereri TaxID=42514 RepID=UPI001890E9D1|nr:uncharacterized protein LOC108417063 isoform X1 [Pygocentrus nattereri]